MLAIIARFLSFGNSFGYFSKMEKCNSFQILRNTLAFKIDYAQYMSKENHFSTRK